MNSIPETVMMEKRPLILEKGYDPEDFTPDYWLTEHQDMEARINKNPKSIVDYLTDICEKFSVGGPFLDIGAGTGNIVNGLRSVGLEAEGCEFSESGRKLSFETYGIGLCPCDLRRQLPYYTDQFNWSTCIGVLSMIPQFFLPNAIKEIIRVTKYGVLVNVQTIISAEVDFWRNPHHLTSLSHVEYESMFYGCGGHDLTSIQPPQKEKYGIGIRNEFSGLFSKRSIHKLLSVKETDLLTQDGDSGEST